MSKDGILTQPSHSGPLDANFDKLVDETLKDWHVPGISVAVVDGDSTWTKVHQVHDFHMLVLIAF
jgi:CubicO group peptidase (beta-lactamase class C family)